MDTHKSKMQKDGEILAQLHRCKVAVGAKQLKKALLSGRASRVILARNADPAITEPIALLSREKGTPCFWVSAMADLGKACGIDVGAAAAAVITDSVLPENSVEYKPTER